MKKFFTISALVAASFGFSMNANADVVTYDFSEFEEQVILADENYTYQYRELTLVGNDTEGYEKDYVSASARFHCNGNSSPKRRYISFTPEANGTLTVSYRSNNNSATDRITAVGTAVVTGADMEALLADEQVVAAGFTDGSTEQTISAELVAGTTYYAYFANGGQSIMSLTWTAEEVAPQGYGFEGTGTEEDPYLLATADDFATLAAKINADNTGAGEYFKLTGDIDFAGAQLPMIALDAITNVNTVAYGFEGVIDGAGYSVKGVKHEQPARDDAYSSYVGIVSSLGENGVIKNLTVEGEITAYMYVGTVAGLSCGTIENCVNNATVTHTGAYGAGIAGGMVKGKGVISNCENNGTVTGNGGTYSCGIMGMTQRHSSIESYNYVVENCTNYADITCSNVGAAGIAGTYCGLIYNCENSGEVKAGGQYVGGIVACATNEAITLKKCVNEGGVSGSAKVGGIAGELRHEQALLDGCFNSGVIEDDVVTGNGIVGTDADETKVKNVGGLVGNSTKVGATIKHSGSYTAVTVPASVETAGHLIGNAEIIVEDSYYFAPDAALPLDDETLALASVEDAINMWYDTFTGTMVVTTAGQSFEFVDQTIEIIYVTSDVATITIPEITYGSYVIDEFSVDVPYTVAENGYNFACGEYAAQAGEYAISGTSVEGAQTGDDINLSTVFTVGRMPMPITVTFTGKKDGLVAIETIEARKAENGMKFDLQGRRTNGEKGFFIENGKVFIVR